MLPGHNASWEDFRYWDGDLAASRQLRGVWLHHPSCRVIVVQHLGRLIVTRGAWLMGNIAPTHRQALDLAVDMCGGGMLAAKFGKCPSPACEASGADLEPYLLPTVL